MKKILKDCSVQRSAWSLRANSRFCTIAIRTRFMVETFVPSKAETCSCAIGTFRENSLKQEEWIRACEAVASESSWIDLKRAPDPCPMTLVTKLHTQQNMLSRSRWALAAECYEQLTNHFENMAPLFRRFAICRMEYREFSSCTDRVFKGH
jgi:hypothetical protein